MRMPTIWILAAALTLAMTASAPAGAQAPAPRATPSPLPAPDIAIAPAANDAVEVVNRFFAAMTAGDLQAAGELLDPRVTVLANGVLAENRAAYLAGIGKNDAAFLKRAPRALLKRVANTDGTIAWVVSQKLFNTAQPGGAAMELLNAETVILARGAQGWKIIHAHWSSRPAPSRQATTRPGVAAPAVKR